MRKANVPPSFSAFLEPLLALKYFFLLFYTNCCMLNGKNGRKKCRDPGLAAAIAQHRERVEVGQFVFMAEHRVTRR